jgi:DNA-binding MarR family transcriptional regulator
MADPSPTTGTRLSANEIDEEGVDVTFLVWLTARATSDLMDSTLAPVGITGDEYAIYSVLAASESITPTELARWMAAPPTSVSSYVKRLQSRGHVERSPHPSDGRSYTLRLTSSGRKAHRAAVRLFAPVRQELNDALGDDEPGVRRSLLALRPVLDDLRTGPLSPTPLARTTTRS